MKNLILIVLLLSGSNSFSAQVHQFQNGVQGKPPICVSCPGTWSSGSYPITCSSGPGTTTVVKCADGRIISNLNELSSLKKLIR